eukprot:COSAG02_NODE_6287_length_3674_cov_22.702098_1_plen_731_part_00
MAPRRRRAVPAVLLLLMMMMLMLGWKLVAGAASLRAPAVTVPLTLGGKDVLLPVVAGADADEVARAFGEKQGLGPAGIATVARIVWDRQAEAAGKSLKQVIPVNLGDRNVHLPLFDGVTHQQAAQAFVAEHKLGADVSAKLISAMVQQEADLARDAATNKDAQQHTGKQADAAQAASAAAVKEAAGETAAAEAVITKAAADEKVAPELAAAKSAEDKAATARAQNDPNHPGAAEQAAQRALAAALKKRAEEQKKPEPAAEEQTGQEQQKREREEAQQREQAAKEQRERKAAQQREERERVAAEEQREREEAQQREQVAKEQRERKAAQQREERERVAAKERDEAQERERVAAKEQREQAAKERDEAQERERVAAKEQREREEAQQREQAAKERDEAQERERVAAKEQREREEAQQREQAAKKQRVKAAKEEEEKEKERKEAHEPERVTKEKLEQAQHAARVKQQMEQEKVAKAKIDAFKAQQRAAKGEHDSGGSEAGVQQLRQKERKAVMAEVAAKSKLTEQNKGDAKAALDEAEAEKMEMMEEAVPPRAWKDGEGKAAQRSATADGDQAGPHTGTPTERRPDEVQEKSDLSVGNAKRRLAREHLKQPLPDDDGDEGGEYLLPHYTQEEVAKMEEQEHTKRVAACTSLGCAIREQLRISSTTSMVMGIVVATVGVCVLLDRYGVEDTSCCRRSHSAEELRRIRQIGASNSTCALIQGRFLQSNFYHLMSM